MSLLGMPCAMINLGCEMVFILHQRLGAQGIAADKAAKVLRDVCGTLFEPAFLADKLFLPQDMYSLPSTRRAFERIAHSSIMKLSENSLDKLFDLMVMGAKCCLLCSARLEDMLEVTLRHLAGVQALVASATAAASPGGAVDAATTHLISNAEEATRRFYGSLGAGELLLLRATLARYLQDKRVRVSLFLAEGIQLPSGKLVLPSCLHADVGLVRSFEGGRLVAEERLPAASQRVPAAEFFCHPLPLGGNLYCKDRPKVVPPARSGDGSDNGMAVAAAAAAPQGPAQHEAPAGSGDSRYARAQAGPLLGSGSKAAAQELEFLAAIVHAGVHGGTPAADNFKLQLSFDDVDLSAVAGAPAAQGVGQGGGGGPQQMLRFGGDAAAYAARVLEGVCLEEGDGDQEAAGGALDLLALMDGAVGGVR